MRRLVSLIYLGISLFLTGACTVLEDRNVCPCWLVFVLDNVSDHFESFDICGYRSGTLFSDQISLEEFPSAYEKEVDKGTVLTCVFTGLDKSVLDGYDVFIPEGEQADRLYLHRNIIDCVDEFAYDSVSMHKEWVKVTAKVFIDGEQVIEDIEDYSFEVRSSICGVNLLDGTPVYGTFRHIPESNEQGEFVFRIPRHEGQAEELFMDIFKEGTLVDDMPLGRLLSSSQLDWSEPSLDDADMEISLSTGDVFIEVIPWVDLGHENLEF